MVRVTGAFMGRQKDARITLESSGRCRAAITPSMAPKRPKTLTMRLVAPFLGGTMRRSTREEVEGLRAYVERGPEALAARSGHASPG